MVWLKDILVNGITYTIFKVIGEDRLVVKPAYLFTTYAAS